jgi:hypothetical protein
MAVRLTERMLTLENWQAGIPKQREQQGKQENLGVSLQLIRKNPGLIVKTTRKTITMSLTLRTTLGCTEAIIADDGNLNLFYRVAGIINEDLRLKFLKKEDEFDSISWSFKFKGHTLTLQYDIYNGISVLPTKAQGADVKDNKAVVELAAVLEGKLIDRELLRNIA